MPVPVQVKKIPWFKQYVLIISIITTVVLAVTIYYALQAKDMLLYPRLTVEDVIFNSDSYKDQQVDVKGLFVDMSTRQKPLCVPQGGAKKYPDIVSGYQTYPSKWAISDGSYDLAIKIVGPDGKEVDGSPKYHHGESVQIKGTVETDTTLDNCNLDIAYKTSYLVVPATELGIK